MIIEAKMRALCVESPPGRPATAYGVVMVGPPQLTPFSEWRCHSVASVACAGWTGSVLEVEALKRAIECEWREAFVCAALKLGREKKEEQEMRHGQHSESGKE
jgi:hypothetical protein